MSCDVTGPGGLLSSMWGLHVRCTPTCTCCTCCACWRSNSLNSFRLGGWGAFKWPPSGGGQLYSTLGGGYGGAGITPALPAGGCGACAPSAGFITIGPRVVAA
eukprot:1181170-Prorocentrum_minimum.AAC.2